MLERLGADELVEWMAWERITGPLGQARQDIQMAHLCCVLANLQRSSKAKPFKIEDFMLFASPLMEKSSRSGRGHAIADPSAQLAVFKAWATAAEDLERQVRSGEPVKGDAI